MGTNMEALQVLYKTMTGQSKEFTTNAEALEAIAKNFSNSGSNLPKLFLTGDMTGISKKNPVDMVAEYVDNGNRFSNKCTLKWQGASSLNYPKKNFTIKLGSKVDFGYGKQKKYCLKANYIDHSHARNIVSARLWSEIVASRSRYEELPKEIKESPNNGVINGFPIKLYLNGKYEGIYTLNIPKDAWMFNMDDEVEEHCVLCGENYGSGCFRAAAKIDGSDWSDEIHDKVPAIILKRWNEIISFVMDSADEEFKENIDNYIDLESLIDYYIFAYVSCGLDSMGKNQIYCTYDGQKWYASMYDMDSTWGLYWNGSSFVSKEYRCQEDYESMKNGRKGNLLFERISTLFHEEIVERYEVLRDGVLSINNIICKFEKFTDLISSDLYTEDIEIYTGIPSKTTNNIKQIRTYAKERLEFVDKNIGVTEVGLTGISLSSGSTFTVNGKIKLTTTLEPSNANTYELEYESSKPEVATVNETGVVTGVAEGTAIITVKDALSGVSSSLEITVKEAISLDENLVFSLSNTSIENSVITDFEKDGVAYPVTTEGTLAVDESDNGIIFDGTQRFLIDISKGKIAGDVPRSFVVTFMLDETADTSATYQILGHTSAALDTDGHMKWGSGTSGYYAVNNTLVVDLGTTDFIKRTENLVTLSKGVKHTLATVYDKENAIFKIYFDGSFVRETTELTYNAIKSCKNVGISEKSFLGKIYNLSVYDKALTEEEIASL